MEKNVLELFSVSTAEWFQETFGEPTKVQKEAWPAIAAGNHVLVSAPTGTGKTLSAFLVFIDHLNGLAREGMLKDELYLIYVSPLKSLAGDIRENLNRPLDGIPREEGQKEIRVGLRTGDTPQSERQKMVRRPPHILIITPESLYLMLTSKSGRQVIKTAKAIILDELHALIDTKRGAHLMLSIARLDLLCGRPLQRIGLSATIEPLGLAAEYLAPEPVTICAPNMEKKIHIEVIGTAPAEGRRKDPVWKELGFAVFQKCQSYKSVIAFSEGRRYAEKLAYYVNEYGGDGFARVHHGSLSKEQRLKVEEELRDGRLRLLCATSSMELGIDVGDVELVLQIGCPRTVSSTMQRLGRAGHRPEKTSVMYMYPRTALESIYCGMTAEEARLGGVEEAKPPRMCLDILAQHLVSMSAAEPYSLEDVMEILKRTYSFCEVGREDVHGVLCMLSGDYEHNREVPARPRVLYDRINARVSGDAYSRMLAVAAGGTIPDKGMYTAKTEEGVILGELDEEFVYESQIGDRFVLGSFAWQIVRQDRDSVIVRQTDPAGARLPFWKGETKGRSLKTCLEFGGIFGRLERAYEAGELEQELEMLGLDKAAALNAAGFLRRQMEAAEGLPDDRTVLMEHFKDSTGNYQIMVHAMFGRRVNAPLSLLAQYAAGKASGLDIGCVDDEEGFLLYPYGGEELPEGLLYQIDPGRARALLEAMLPLTPVFSMTFRYNAARSLMMGMHRGGRQPLWVQRLKSAELQGILADEKSHPLVRETRRECLEDLWDIDGAIKILQDIRSGLITVREMHLELPSPMSLPFQWQTETAQMYEYSPTTQKINQSVYEDLKQAEMIKPFSEELAKKWERKRLPENEEQLHALLMMEGDITAGELPVPVEWLENLAGRGQAAYMEPGIWIAAEQQGEYERALLNGDEEACMHIVRRMLYYRGAQSAGAVQERYFLKEERTKEILKRLCGAKEAVEHEGIYYHGKLYKRARENSIKSLRMQTATQPRENYAALAAELSRIQAGPEEQLKQVMEKYSGRVFPAAFWESVLFPGRVKNYSEGLLDRLLAQGDCFWQIVPGQNLCFCRYEDIDWDGATCQSEELLDEDERLVYQELQRRGACFLKFLTGVPRQRSAQDVLLSLAQKGLVCADSFIPVRQWLNQDKIKKSAARQRVNARVRMLDAGRWDIVRPLRKKTAEDWIWSFLKENKILCRETFQKSMESARLSPYMSGADAADTKNAKDRDGILSWREALEYLRVWEYTGKVRRGYFVEGMSGAQFMAAEEYDSLMAALKRPSLRGQAYPEEAETSGASSQTSSFWQPAVFGRIIWLNASDPALLWGKVLEHEEGRSFLGVPGTAAALKNGRVAAVMERQGKILRVYEWEGIGEVLLEFARDFKAKSIFPGKKRLIVKEYPQEAQEALKKAGFMKEMQDYVLYR